MGWGAKRHVRYQAEDGTVEITGYSARDAEDIIEAFNQAAGLCSCGRPCDHE